MSAEVDVLPLHVLHLPDKVQIVHIRSMFLCGHADLAAALVHFVDDGVLRFQLVHTVGKRGVVLVGIQQIHHNIAVDLRKGVLNSGWQVKIAVAHGAHFLIVFILNGAYRFLLLKSLSSYILEFFFIETQLNFKILRCEESYFLR